MTRETAWVIETANNTYWDGHGTDRGSFVESHDKAIRFARFVDAEVVRCWLLERFTFALRSAEHVWLDADPSVAAGLSVEVGPTSSGNGGV